jgi:hypothetical protein
MKLTSMEAMINLRFARSVKRLSCKASLLGCVKFKMLKSFFAPLREIRSLLLLDEERAVHAKPQRSKASNALLLPSVHKLFVIPSLQLSVTFWRFD